LRWHVYAGAAMSDYQIHLGDCIDSMRQMPDQSVHCCVTSPPYFGLRDYGHDGQIGLEPTPEEFVAKLVEVFREVRRVLRDDGTLWLNLGDSYNSPGPSNHGKSKEVHRGTNADKWVQGISTKRVEGLKVKDLIGIPWRVAFSLQADGWYLRQDIIWHKPNPMPESVTDRCTKSHEYIFLLSKSATYYYDHEAIKELSVNPEGSAKRYKTPFFVGEKHESGGYSMDGSKHTPGLKEFEGTRNKRSVWTVTTKPYAGAHFATFPPDLIEPCILAGCPERCCSQCGKPWERLTEQTKTFESGSGKSGNPITGKQDLTSSQTNSTPDIRMGPTIKTVTLGFQAVCSCEDGVIGGTVLDPFGGSGTTAGVALANGRNAILCELNPAYKPLIVKRVAELRLKNIEMVF
jgi:site-specific DNA-methyltransferase (adenine-specific)